MYGYVARRILATLPVLGIVALVVFAILHLSPGDPAGADRRRPGHAATDCRHSQQARSRSAALSSNSRSGSVACCSGDLGVSIFSNQPVTRLLAQRMEPTISLTLTTTIVMVLLAVPIGVIAAWRADTWIDHAVMTLGRARLLAADLRGRLPADLRAGHDLGRAFRSRATSR